MSLLRSILFPCAMLAAGCTARGYSGPPLPAGEFSTIAIHTTGKVSLEETVVDRLKVIADTIEVIPGTNTVQAAYRFTDDTQCSSSDLLCLTTEERGVCTATVYTKPGRDYLVTIENRNGYLSGRVSAKGYFDLTERSDEGTPGSVSCRKTAARTIYY